jgi:hypothetical protein
VISSKFFFERVRRVTKIGHSIESGRKELDGSSVAVRRRLAYRHVKGYRLSFVIISRSCGTGKEHE